MLGLVSPAQADDAARLVPAPEEVRIVERCVSAARTAADRRLCIGAVATPCQETPEGATTLGSGACLGREHRIWDGLLNAHYSAAAAAFGEEGRVYLKDAQRAWLVFRDRACEWPYKAYAGGSIAGPLAVECLMTQTALRALGLLELKETLEQR